MKRMKRKLIAFLVLISIAAAGLAIAASGGSYEVSWFTLEPASGGPSTGGAYALVGVIGQSEAYPAEATGGNWSLRGGFLVPIQVQIYPETGIRPDAWMFYE